MNDDIDRAIANRNPTQLWAAQNLRHLLRDDESITDAWLSLGTALRPQKVIIETDQGRRVEVDLPPPE